MEKKLFVVNMLTEHCDEAPIKEAMCLFEGTQEDADRIEAEYGIRNFSRWHSAWVEIEEVKKTNDIATALKYCGIEVQGLLYRSLI